MELNYNIACMIGSEIMMPLMEVLKLGEKCCTIFSIRSSNVEMVILKVIIEVIEQNGALNMNAMVNF